MKSNRRSLFDDNELIDNQYLVKGLRNNIRDFISDYESDKLDFAKL